MAAHGESAGVLPAALACVFGLLGIFFIGIIFVPLAALCALVGLVRGLGSHNLTAIGLSLLAGVLCFSGFMTSPSLWLLFGLGAATALLGSQHVSPSVVQPSPRMDYSTYQPAVAPAFDVALGKNLVLRMDRYDNAVDNYLRDMEGAKNRYRSITAKMNEYFQKEQTLAGNPDAATERGQLSVAISQGSVATDQYHIDVQQIWSEFETQVSPLNQATATFQQECGRLPITANDPPAWRISCEAFDASLTEAKKKANAIKAGFADLENFYSQEHQMQADLISQSEQIE